MKSTSAKVFRVLVPGLLTWSLQASLQAADGVLVVQKTTAGTRVETSQVQIEKTRMRAEVAGPNGVMQVIFDSTKQVLWLIDNTRMTYNEITKAEAEQMGGQLSAAMAEMQAQLASLPPAQRAQVEAMMRGRGMPGLGAPQQTEYRRNGTDRVGRWTCNKYDGFQGTQKTSEVCTIAPRDTGLTEADFEVSKAFAEFLSKLVPQAADGLFKLGGAEPQGFAGIPVKRISENGQSVSEVTDLTRQTFPESTFTLPAGFRKEAFPGAPGGRGR